MRRSPGGRLATITIRRRAVASVSTPALGASTEAVYAGIGGGYADFRRCSAGCSGGRASDGPVPCDWRASVDRSSHNWRAEPSSSHSRRVPDARRWAS